MTNNPWKKLSSKEIYKNPWISVREDQVVQPDGNPGIYSVVETRLAVGVLALTPQDEIYLVGQYRYPTENYSWEIIEGGSDDQESALETAKRELEEEAGLQAEIWEPLGKEIHLSNCFSSEVGCLFLARDLIEVAKRPDPTEVLEIKKVPFKEALKMIENGGITDALSIIAILSYNLSK